MSFEKSKIVPELLDRAPDEILKVEFSEATVDLGNALTKEGTAATPDVTFSADANSLYTLIMPDPDTAVGIVLHWLIVNIPGDKISEGQIKASYRGPGPPPGSGIHRYIFLVYKQASRLEDVEEYDTNRRYFDFRGFINKHCLGDPTHGNFFTVNAN